MVLGNALLTTVHLGLNLRTHRTTCPIFVKPKIVNTPFGLLDA